MLGVAFELGAFRCAPRRVASRVCVRVLALAAFVLATLALAALAPSASAATGNLSYQGGPVLHSSAPYLVFWTPGGESIPAGSEALLQRYLTDTAADSGGANDVFGVLRQYYDHTGFADYRQTFDPSRQVIVDPQPYPPRDKTNCPDVSSFYPTCISDGQMQSELKRLTVADRLPTDGPSSAQEFSANAPIYLVILPANVEFCENTSSLCSDNAVCGYHGNAIDTRGNTVLYAVIALQALRAGSKLAPDPKGVCQFDNTPAIQAPNGDVNADIAIHAVSHEYSETITDPLAQAGWQNAATLNEVGDQCGGAGSFDPAKGYNPNAFMPTLGGSASAGTLFDQLINGHPYYTQSEWSNGAGTCALRPAPGTITPRLALLPGPTAAGLPLGFTPAASTSTNPPSSATWNFGDGSRTAFFAGKAALTRATHRYRTAGRYTVTLTLVDDQGNLRSTTQPITVTAAVCLVPNVTGKSLSAARSALRAAHCSVGNVNTPRRPKHSPGRHKHWKLVVGHESPRAGSIEPIGTRVRLMLVYTAARN